MFCDPVTSTVDPPMMDANQLKNLEFSVGFCNVSDQKQNMTNPMAFDLLLLPGFTFFLALTLSAHPWLYSNFY